MHFIRDNGVLFFVFVILIPGWLMTWTWQLPQFVHTEFLLRGVTLCLSIALAAGFSILFHLLPGKSTALFMLATGALIVGLATTMQFVHVSMFGALLNISALYAMAGTSTGEISEFIGFLPQVTKFAIVIYWLTLLAALCSIAIKYKSRAFRLHRLSVATASVMLLPAVALAAYSDQQSTTPNITFPAALKEIVGNDLMVRSSLLSGRYKEERRQLAILLSRRADISPTIVRASAEPLTVVLVLGESANRKNLAVYGYPLDTTPHLAKLQSELLLMNAAVSPATVSLESVVRMLTHASNDNKERWVESSSVINVAKAAGYKTYWLSNQGQLGQYDTAITVLGKEAGYFKSINTGMVNISDDMKLLPLLSDVIHNEDTQQFVVLHLMGSHYNYNRRFPAEEAVLTMDDYPSKLDLSHYSGPALQRLADYDNSIRYTDKFLSRTVEMLDDSGRNSVLIYVSDHGEEVSENMDRFGHGNPIVKPEHVDVPFLIWQSEQPRDSEFLASRSHSAVENREFSTEDLFHTLISLLDIETNEYDAAADVLSSEYRPQEILIYTPQGDYALYSDMQDKFPGQQ